MRGQARRLLWVATIATAAIVAVAIACHGPTRPSPLIGACGGFEGLPCGQGQVCELPAGQCETADLFGTCVARPDFCTEQFDPVCGCDGVTYSNDCFRRMAGVQKRHDGACPAATAG